MISEVCLLYICMPKVQWEDHCSKKNVHVDKYNMSYKFRIRGLGTAVLPWQQNYKCFFMRLVMYYVQNFVEFE